MFFNWLTFCIEGESSCSRASLNSCIPASVLVSKYCISSILGNSINKFEIKSGSLTLILIAGSFSHVDKSDLILM